MELIDICFNATDPKYSDDLGEVIQRALAHGVFKMIVPGSCIDSSVEGVRLMEMYPKMLYPTVGVHPLYAPEEFTARSIERLKDLAIKYPVLAIGECGLDYHPKFNPDSVKQKRWFYPQALLAKDLDLPLYLHEREAYSDVMEVLCSLNLGPRVVVHCFDGTLSELQGYLDIGCYIGVTGLIAMKSKRSRQLLKVIPSIPLDRLMVETDSPWLSPSRQFKSRNEPCTLTLTLQVLAGAYNMNPEEISAITVANTKRFFKL